MILIILMMMMMMNVVNYDTNYIDFLSEAFFPLCMMV